MVATDESSLVLQSRQGDTKAFEQLIVQQKINELNSCKQR
jgi:hypothetical protein